MDSISFISQSKPQLSRKHTANVECIEVVVERVVAQATGAFIMTMEPMKNLVKIVIAVATPAIMVQNIMD